MLTDKPTKVRAYYDQYASNYDSFYREIQAQKFLSCKRYLEESNLGLSLDLGGGTGLLSEWLNQPLITADLSYSMLLEGLQQKRVYDPIACDLSNMPMRRNSINHIYSFTAIQNLTQPETAFPEIKRLLIRLGTGIITVLSKKITEEQISAWARKNDLNPIVITIPIEDVGVVITNS
jgi:ubiquinone/menaquinone biosynthesis C-methylase UbiE